LPASTHSAEIAAAAPGLAAARRDLCSGGDPAAMRNAFVTAALTTAAALILTVPVSAKTFRWANDGDIVSMDPYARQESS
jgi:hypothetical protein